jgi:glutathione S-transferase
VLRLYDYAASANCYKVRLLLAELEREYERVPVDIFAGGTMTPEYGRMNPGLTTPVLEIEQGAYLAESGAILLYLADGTALLPEDGLERAQVHRWLFFEQASIVSVIGALRFRVLTGRLDPDSEEAQRQRTIAAAVVATVNAQLAEREFAAGGGFSVADIALYGYLHVADEAGVDMGRYSNLAAWLERVRKRPRHVADLAPYPANSHRGASRSIYDMVGF